MSKELIRLVNLKMAFDDEIVLDDINLYFNDKEFLTLLGPSGCGKTTTLRIIGGFIKPTSGDVLFDGERINDVPPHKRKVNTVFQKYALFPHLDVYENVAFGLRLNKLPEEEIDERVTEMLEIVSLKGFENRKVSQLSGGQQQRIAIARAVLKNSPILILDEATSAVDNETEALIQQAIDELSKNRTVIVIAHRLSTVMKADNIIVLENGRIAEQGTHNELLKLGGIYAKLCNVNSDRIKAET